MASVIGIDLGTTNSCACVIQGNRPVVIPGLDGGRLTPSAVHFCSDGTVQVGRAALQNRILDPENTIVGIKRLMGRQYNEVVDLARNAAFKVLPGKNNLAVIDFRGRQYFPQEISAYILRSLKQAAEIALGQTVTQTVITIPAYFGDRQRQATREAAVIAGLEPLRIINEPTAAALAYGLGKTDDEKIAVFDLGGGTFDITLLEIGDGVHEVKAISGDGFLGGDDFDQCLVDWVADELLLDYGIVLTESPSTLEQVREAAIEAKCELSTRHETSIHIPFLSAGATHTVPLRLDLTRKRFETVCEELFARMIPPCRRILRDAGLPSQRLDRVVLVGAATRMPRIEEVVIQAFGRKPSRAVNPDEAVAIGAAVQGSVLRGETRDVLLLDVTPHSLGLEAADGTRVTLIERNTTIPTRQSDIFTTCADNQSSVEINILEGDHRLALENRLLGRVILDEIDPAPQGVPQIEVVFDIDANGVRQVSAKDLGTGREKRLSVRAQTGLDLADLPHLVERVAAMKCF